MQQTIYLPANVFYYYITWTGFYEDFTWEQMDLNWNL